MKPLLCVTAPAGWKLHLRWEVCVLHPTNCRRAGVAQPFAGGKAVTITFFRHLVAAVYLRHYSTWNFP